MLTEMSPAELFSYERELRLRGPAGPTFKCKSFEPFPPYVSSALLEVLLLLMCIILCAVLSLTLFFGVLNN